MNLHVVVEGMTEKPVYKRWIPFVYRGLKYVDSVLECVSDNFSIVSGGGYPNYLDVVAAAVEDVNSADNIHRLIVAVDSENMDCREKREEVEQFLSDKPCSARVFVVVQHFCLETWALGNKKLGPRHPDDSRLRAYKRLFNVLTEDPEAMPPHEEEGRNRSQFALLYLKLMLREKQLRYTKTNPEPLLNWAYFEQVRLRQARTGHVSSFSAFLEAFRPNPAK